jgi:small subunit ribosomal protein S7
MENQSNLYSHIVSSKMLNLLMIKGKKNAAKRILNLSLEQSFNTLGADSKSVILTKAVFNASPDLEIKTKKIGTTLYHIPRSVTIEKKIKIGIKFILEAARSRKEYTMIDRLAAELTDAYNYRGVAIKKKEEVHKIAESNKSFSHFNW